MNNPSHKIVSIRVTSDEDLSRIRQWSQDEELNALDPPTTFYPDGLNWSVYVDNVHVGLANIYNRVGVSTEIGIRIGNKDYWGHGFGTSAVLQLLSYCRTLGYSYVHMKVLPNNPRAIRCYEKCGFRRNGTVIVDGINFIYMEARI